VNRASRRIRIYLALLFVFCLALGIALTYHYIDQRRQIEATAFALAEQQAANAVQQIESVFSELRVIADQIAADLSDGTLNYADIDPRMQAELIARPDVDGIAVTFAPFAYSSTQRLYQSYNYHQSDGSMVQLSGATYDYTLPVSDTADAPQTAWYHTPLEQGSIWLEPFLATGAGRVLIEYGTPFFRRGAPSSPAGVVTIDFSLGGMHDLMGALDLGDTGYGFVISQAGTFLAHPDSDVIAQENIFAEAQRSGDAALGDSMTRALNGETITIDSFDQVSGQYSRIFLQPIPETDWVLGIVLYKSELLIDSSVTLQEQVGILLSFSGAACFGLALLFRVERGTTRALWQTAIGFSVICTIAIIIILALTFINEEVQGIEVVSQTAANRYTEAYLQSVPADTQVYMLPTGVLVEALAFPTPTSATINGYVWQRYNAADMPEDFMPGFYFPQISGGEYFIDEADRVENGDEVIVLWRFGLDIVQAFDPARFPFDSRSVALQIVPSDAGYTVMLTPDLSEYVLINPALMPGTDDELFVNNWKLMSSQFSYHESPLNRGLVLQDSLVLNAPPELYFNINMQRNFVGPLIAYLLPGLVAAGLMFAFLTSDPKVGDQEEIISTLGFTAALFFVITVAHTALRDNVAAVGITYLENFYLVLYLVIILASINAFLVVRVDIPILRYRNNLLPKLLYFPLFSGIMLLVTLGMFVYG
jgi:hypothetical protein